jgi:protein-S-isoprenylcysteine O-methyltransferase Ste14
MEVAGSLPLLLGLALNVVADRQFKQAKTTVKPFQRSSALVTNGAYRICRHPMYWDLS